MVEGKNYEMTVSATLREKTIIAAAIIIALLIGLLSDDYPMFYFGLVFAFSGFFPPLWVNKIGLLFLFTHTGSGLAIVMYSFYDKIWDNPILSDGFTTSHVLLYTLLIISILMAVMSFITMFIYNLNKKARETNYFITLPFIFCSLSIFTVGIASVILSYFI